MSMFVFMAVAMFVPMVARKTAMYQTNALAGHGHARRLCLCDALFVAQIIIKTL